GLLDRFQRANPAEDRLIQTATDGESYGHHFKFGDRCLAFALDVEAAKRGLEPTNYGAFLAAHPPAQEVEVKAGPNGEGTAWSCAHGVGRWYRDCGCSGGAREGWNQAWRTPLRNALDLLRDEAARLFEQEAGRIFPDPWAAREAYIELVLDPKASRREFLERHAGRALGEEEQVRGLTWLEAQRNALLMYTSCGWFFDDISGIEAVQVMKYAGRVLDFLDELEVPSPRDRFLELLAGARSNIPEMGNGADCFRRFVEPCRVSPEGVAAHVAILGVLADSPDRGEVAGYAYRKLDAQLRSRGRVTLSTAHLVLEHAPTGKRLEYAVAAMRFGGVDFYAVMKPFPGAQRFRRSAEHLWTQFPRGSLPALLRVAQDEFGPDEYGLEHVLPEGRQRISALVFGDIVKKLSEQYARLYEENRRTIEILHEAGFDLPEELRAAAEFSMGKRFEEEIRRQRNSHDPAAYQAALEIAAEVTRGGYRIDRTAASRIFSDMIADAVGASLTEPDDERVRAAVALIALTRRLSLEANLDHAQELVYSALANGTPAASSGPLRELAV
ncbi:MAG TPA: DUF3536 domain-containing protein, partial [Planctomycetota bacterium]|nr:DUF3536 domain-containing protein [Planctomycetota bacterium]